MPGFRMSGEVPLTNPSVTAVTTDTALLNAVRLLQNAETITDLTLMQRLNDLADSWLEIAALLNERG